MLEKVNLSVDSDDSPLVLVLGCTGSYKSSLLQAILGEMPRVRGGLECVGSVAYVQQVPFIMTGTVRDNILFGKKFDQKLYNETLSGCCLLDDLLQLPAGEHTMIGKRGIHLSDDQKMRVCLARAVYADADIYLIDDALAAVDDRVGERLFHCVLIDMLSDKIRLVVTNQIHYAKFADKIVLMSGFSGNEDETKSANDSFASTRAQKLKTKRHTRSGRVEEVGSYHQLMLSQSSRLPGMMLEAYQSNSENDSLKQQTSISDVKSLKKKTIDSQQTPKYASPIASSANQEGLRVGRTLLTKEDRKRGRVACSVFYRYAKAMSLWMWISCVIWYIISEAIRVVTGFFIAAWCQSNSPHHAKPAGNSTSTLRTSWLHVALTHIKKHRHMHSIASGTQANDTSAFMTVYMLLVGGIIVVSTMRIWLLVSASLRAAKKMYV